MDNQQRLQQQNQKDLTQHHHQPFPPQQLYASHAATAAQSKYPSRVSHPTVRSKNRFFNKGGYASNPAAQHQRQPTEYQQRKPSDWKQVSNMTQLGETAGGISRHDVELTRRDDEQHYGNQQEHPEHNGTFVDSVEIQDDDVPQKILVSPRQRKITQIIGSGNQPLQVDNTSPQKMFGGPKNGRFNRPPTSRGSEAHENPGPGNSSHANAAILSTRQRSTADIHYATEQKGQTPKMTSATGAATTGTSASQMSAANKPFHFNQARSSLKQMEIHHARRPIAVLDHATKNYQTIDPADTGHSAQSKLNSQHGRLNFRHQSEQLQTAVNLPTSCTNNDLTPLNSHRGAGNSYQASALTARGAYYTRHQDGPIGGGGSQRQHNHSKQFSEKASSKTSSSKMFQFRQGQPDQSSKGHANGSSDNQQQFAQTQKRPQKRQQLSQNDMMQVCAEGDNEFAESIAESSALRDSAPRERQQPPPVKGKSGVHATARIQREKQGNQGTVSETNAALYQERAHHDHTRNAEDGFDSFQTQVDPRFAHVQAYNQSTRKQPEHSQPEHMFEQIKKKLQQDARLPEYHLVNNKQNSKARREDGNTENSIYFKKESTPKSDVYYKQSITCHQQASYSINRLSSVSIQTPKPQPKPFNPPRASFNHLKKSGGRPSQHQRQKSRGKGSLAGAKLDNHKNEMLGGDSEYSDIDVNSDEERDDDSRTNQNGQSDSEQSNGLNDSKYSHSKPEDRQRSGPEMGAPSSRHHKVRDLSKQTYSRSSEIMIKKLPDNQRTNSEDKTKQQDYLQYRRLRQPSSSMRSQKSYFENQYNAGQDVAEFQINNENDGLKEGSAYIVQESNGPGSRCRKGSLNFRNKLNNKVISDRIAKNNHMKLYKQQKNKHQDNIDNTSDDSHVDLNLSKGINRQILKKNMKSKVVLPPEGDKAARKEGELSREPSTANLDPNIDERCQRNLVTNKSPFQGGSLRQKSGSGTNHRASRPEQPLEMFPRRSDGGARQHFSEDESCDANVETIDADSSTRSLNRQQSVSINRNIFELSLKLHELTEVPLSKLKSNQQLKILDLSRNKIQVLPADMFHFLPNLKKIVLDYNLLVSLPKIEDNHQIDKSTNMKPNQSSIKESTPILQKLNHFSATNNKINEFPISLFLKFKHLSGHDGQQESNHIVKGPIQMVCTQRQNNIQHIGLNDNNIQQIPSIISLIKSLRTLMLHSNPLSALPLSLKEIWPQFDVFSIDWFTYLQPLVGKILRVDNSSSFREDTSQAAAGGNTLDEQENQAIELALDNVRDKSRLHMKRDSAQSASRLKHNVVQKKNMSLIPGLQGKGKGTNLNARTTQREMSLRIHDKFFRMLAQIQEDQQQQNHQIDFVTFSQFLLFFMKKKSGSQVRNPGLANREILKALNYGPKERSITHQLIEDNKLVLFRDLINLNAHRKCPDDKPIIDLNELDHDDATPLVMALKNRHNEIAKYLLKFYSEQLNIQLKSKKHGNAINLAIKGQNPEIIDMILTHKQVTSTDSFVLNYIIPNFEKDAKNNAKFMVKLIMDKGMNPNQLRERYLRKDVVQQRKRNDENLPDKIVDVSPIALACMKFQDSAINFIVKYNSTIREILIMNRKIKKKNGRDDTPNIEKKISKEAASQVSQQYWAMIGTFEPIKAARVKKFFTYIEDISKNQGKTLERVIDKNLKLFDFNQLSGPHLMHPLHFAVQANNLKAVEKFKKHMYNEKINFFARDEENYELPQEYAAPSAPIYKIVLRIQKNLISKKYIHMKVEKQTNKTIQQHALMVHTKSLQKNQLSIGESSFEMNKYRNEQFVPIVHRSMNCRRSTFKNPKYIRQNDILNFSNPNQNVGHKSMTSMAKHTSTLSHFNSVNSPILEKNKSSFPKEQMMPNLDLQLNYNTLIQKNVLRNIDNKIMQKTQKQNMKQIHAKKYKSSYQGVSGEGQQHNLTARESQISQATVPYNVSYQVRNSHQDQVVSQRDSHNTNQTNATQKVAQMSRLGGAVIQERPGNAVQHHQSHQSQIFQFENEFNQNNLEVLSNQSSTRRTIRGSEKLNVNWQYQTNYQQRLAAKKVPQIQVNLRSGGGSQMTNRQKPKSTRESLDRFQKTRSDKAQNNQNSNDNMNSDDEENVNEKDAYILINKPDRLPKETQDQYSIESLEMNQDFKQKNVLTPQHSASIPRDWSSNQRIKYTNKVQNQGRIDPKNNIQRPFKNDLSFQKSEQNSIEKKFISQIGSKQDRQRFFKQSSQSSFRYLKQASSAQEHRSQQSNMEFRN